MCNSVVKSVAIVENICERRMLEYDKLCRYFQENDIEISKEKKDVECVVFFSCGMKENDTYREVAETVSKHKNIVVVGCAPSMLTFQKNDYVKLVPLKHMNVLDQIFGVQTPYDSLKISSYSQYNPTKINLYHRAIETWDPRIFTPFCEDVYSIKISEGCSRHCSYCSIRKATGKLKSTPVENIVVEIKNALSSGYKHFRIQCENLSAYGEDIDTNLGVLLNKIGEIEACFDIDLPDLHPDGFIKYFENIKELANKKNIYQLHLPIQSGSNTILKKMNRDYDIDLLIPKLNELKKLNDNLIVGTDIIIGFPGETEQDFELTCKLLEGFRFSPLYIHGYCNKKGTVASKMNNIVSSEIIEKRIHFIQKKHAYAASYLNNYNGGE